MTVVLLTVVLGVIAILSLLANGPVRCNSASFNRGLLSNLKGFRSYSGYVGRPNTLLYCSTHDSDTGIDTIFNILIYCVSQYVTGFAKRYLFHTFDIPANKMS